MVFEAPSRLFRKDPELFVREVFNVQLTPYQIRFIVGLDEDYMHSWVRQSGKNTAIYYATIWKALFFPGTKIFVGTRISRIRATLREIVHILNKGGTVLGISNSLIQYSLSNHSIHFANGSVILFENNLPSCTPNLDYVFFNYDLFATPGNINEYKFSPTVKMHVFDDSNKVVMARGPDGEILSRQLVTWRSTCYGDIEWAKVILNNIGTESFKKSYFATAEDIKEIRKAR